MNTFKKRLVIEVEYDGNTITPEEATDILRKAAYHLEDNHLLDKDKTFFHCIRIEDVPPPLVVRPSKQSWGGSSWD